MGCAILTCSVFLTDLPLSIPKSGRKIFSAAIRSHLKTGQFGSRLLSTISMYFWRLGLPIVLCILLARLALDKSHFEYLNCLLGQCSK